MSRPRIGWAARFLGLAGVVLISAYVVLPGLMFDPGPIRDLNYRGQPTRRHEASRAGLITDSLIIRFRRGTTAAEERGVFVRYRLRVLEYDNRQKSPYYLVETPAGADSTALLGGLKREPSITSAQFNQVLWD